MSPAQAPAFHWCMMRGCQEPAYELEPGLPTPFCAQHRAEVLSHPKSERRKLTTSK